MNRQQLKELRRGLVQEMELDRSANTADICLKLCDVVGKRLRQSIQLKFDDLQARGLSGYWAKLPNGVNIIMVTTARSWTHRLFILLHELAHMICEHEPVHLSAEEGRQLAGTSLPPGLLNIVARRTALTDGDEEEAESVAGDLMRDILAWAGQQPVEPFEPTGSDGATRVWYSLGFAGERG
ncbi:hypothetical protein [Crossiella cryophila]|uniref:IrrE N-terminal-like domain-containing protein n=1 Tax=Crossiella cryophila TaxID=43355 RepID=A0A7W7FVL8_9PSEU|nr:hypothetical protein [Crossiella cryophila]MBB4679432.1 hypothetical protein [Crossiella cryophila]